MLVVLPSLMQSLPAGLADDHAIYGGLHAFDGLLILASRATSTPGRGRASHRGHAVTSSGRATAIVWLLITVLSVANLILTIMARKDLATTDAVSGLIYAPAPVLYATLGALIVRRAGNLIGWMLIGIGAGQAITWLASAYAVLGITHPGTLPAPELVGLLAEWSFIPVFTGIGFMLLLFPSGTLPSPRWRPWAGLGLLAVWIRSARGRPAGR